MTTEHFSFRLYLFRIIKYRIFQIVYQLVWWLNSIAIKIKVFAIFLYHATQWVPSPGVSSRFSIPHSFFFGLYGKLSRTNTPRNLGILSFSTASIISKFVRGLLVNSSPSTEIISLIYIISEIIMSKS